MGEAISTTKQQVPFSQKVAFGMGMLANQMFPAVLGIFMVVLVQDLGFPGWMWGIIYFFPRVFDSITDPIMGFISDNTKSKWGRRRQYVFLGAILMGVAFTVMWQLYRVNGVDYNFAYFLGWSFVFYLGLTIFSVPYVAMGYEMSDDFHERTDIMAVAQWIGQWAWVIAPWFWVVMYDPDWFPSADVATRELAIWVGMICMLFAMVPAIFLKSKPTQNENYEPLTFRTIGRSLKGILKGFKEAFRLKPFRKLCIATFFIFNAFNTIAAFSFFIIVYYLFNGNAEKAGVWPTLFGSLGALVTTFLVIPIVAKMSKKTGKKKAFMISQSISIIGYLMLWFLFVPGKPYMFIFALPFFAFGIGSLFTLMMSMTSDVIDMDELNSGLRREGIFGAIYWWMVKFGFAIAGGLSGVILSVVGFNADVAQQTPDTIIGLRLFYSGFPILGTLVALYVMKDYKVTEEKANEVRAQLERRKKPSVQSSAYSATNMIANYGAAIPTHLDTDVNFLNKSDHEIQELFNKSLESGLHGMSFSPYDQHQQVGDHLSEEQVRTRMEIIAPYTQWIRSFSCIEGNEFIPKVAKEYGLKTLVGAWIGPDKKQNDDEIQSLIALAKKGYADVIAVGNEVLLREDLRKDELMAYIKTIKQAVPEIPVGSVEPYFIFDQNEDFVDTCDVVLANCYPFWEGCSVDRATAFLEMMYNVTLKAAKGKPTMITETGWSSNGEPVGEAVPSPLNAMKFFINANNWRMKNNIQLFYFSSFDESWKIRHEGDIGQNWGIWDIHNRLKYQDFPQVNETL